ncbi:hypothetical protein BC936DRAFT_137598 [Jimgerdemannia flammicorona]|uniref:ubiquitinyl hydrolase 1 n=1 Tax=Jimgerdemannia flammicorona TaxID=994334 RepID=A0A433DJC0_9FUNG|nr:hypothetical protein BC936DRAFT_137598 [Jimgerdemannia flammicorona]
MLEGANQYLCPTCRSMQDAERSIHLKSLPPVLNIQLLRFIYDTTSLTKKKIKRTVRFPKTVDMREFIDIDHCGDAAGKRKRPRTDDGYGDNSRVEDNETKDTSDDEFIYDLTAVLIHNGPSAYSGHFIAHVFDESRKTWFKLDDETVTRLEPNEEFDPDKEKEVPVDKKQPATAGQVKKPRGKGKGKLADDQSQSEKSNQQDQGTQAKETVIMHSSRNAYMLAYTRRSHRRNLTLDACPPPWAGKAVEAANLGFEQDVEEYKQKMESLRDDFERKRMERRSFYTMWNVKSNEDASYYVAADALRTWLHDDFGVSPDVMQNTKARKPEDNDMKVMTDEKRCEEGMVAVASDNDIPMTDLHPALANDRISVDGDVENGRAILMEIDTENEIGYVSKGDCISDETDPKDNKTFDNATITCEHGNLDPLALGKAKRIREAYEYLQQLFPGLECFTNATDVCEACQSLEEMKLEDTKEYREQAEIERNELKSLLNSNKNTRIHGGTSYRLIEKDFLDAWRRFIRNPNNSQRPGMIDNSQFLCADHNKLVYDLNIAEDATCGEFEIIQQDEWDYVIALYKGGPDITLMQMDKVNVEGQEETKSDSRIITVPELCEVHGHQQEVDRKVCAGSTSSSEELANSYDHEHHSFRNNVCSDVIIPNNNGNQPSHILGVEQGGGEDDDDDAADATYRVSSTTSRATRSGRGPQAHKGGRGRIKKTVTRKQRVTVLGPTRRSKRLKRNTGDGTGKADGQMVKVTMNKDDTIMDQLKIVPIYQRLFLEKRELEDNDVTMGQLGVVPGTTIDLVEFEEGEDEGDVVAADDWSQVHKVEGGFKGTGLVGLLFNNGGEGGPVASGTSGSIGWSCSVCTFVNYSEQSVCQICDSPK